MKKILMFSWAFAYCLPVHAHTSEDSWKTTLYFQIMSRYYGTIVGGIFYDGKEMSFTTLDFTHSDELGSTTVALTAGRKLDDIHHDSRDGGHENGFTVMRQFNKGIIWFDFGAVYQSIGRLNQSRDDILQSFIQVAVPEVPFVKPYIRFCQFDKVGRSDIDTGWFIYGGFTREQPTGLRFREKRLTSFWDFRNGYSGNVFGKSRGWAYSRLSASLSLPMGSWEMVPAVVVQTPAGGQKRAFADKTRTFFEVFVSRRL